MNISDQQKQVQEVAFIDSYRNTVASMYLEKNIIGSAIFDSSQKCIKIELIRQQVGISTMVEQYLTKYSVDILLVNQKLKRQIEDIEGLRLVLVNSKDYQSESIESSLLLFDSKDQSVDKKVLLKTVVDWSQGQTVKALGALTYYLMQQRLLDRSFRLDDIIPGCFRQTVSIPKHTYQYLDIIKQQMHPCMSTQGRSKQGFTILNIYLTFTITDLGRKLMIDLFHNPTYNRQVLQDRYNTIGFIHSKLGTHEKTINKCLRKIHNVKAILTEFDRIKNQDEDWRKLRNSLQNMLILQRLILSVSTTPTPTPTLITTLQSLDISTLSSLLSMIDSTLQLNPLQIKSNVFQTLDKLRQSYEDMQHLLTLYAREQDWQFEFTIKYMSQIGYMVIVPGETEVPQNWELQFANGNGQFYTNQLTGMLDERFGDIYGEIMDIEEAVLIDLESHIRKEHEEILRVYTLVGEFDCWFAVAKVSKSLSRPQLTENKLVVVNGWHMLLGEKSINNNAFSIPFEDDHQVVKHNSEQNLVNSNYSNRCCILSGPNGAGKTLYLKQTGIIMFLAHIGSYVPAQLASIPLIDRIASHHFIRSLYIDRFGIQQQSFQLNKILKSLTNRSLLLIDQLGHTTSHNNAIQFMHTTVRYLTQRVFPDNQEFTYTAIKHQRNKRITSMPLTFIITHLYELFNSHLVNLSYEIRFLNAIIYREEEGKKLTFLYKIKPGLFRESVAIESCKCLGLEEEFINNSKQFHEAIKANRPIVCENNINEWRNSTLQMISSIQL